jgi:putative FmdB family regulatory protein
MSLYDFACYDCEISVENVEQGMNDEHKIECPECGKKIGQIYHAPEFHLNGSVTDYYDEGLGLYVPNKAFREETMKAQDLTPYVPEPKMEAARKEACYIRKTGGDGAGLAARKVLKGQARDNTRGRIREALSGQKEEIVKSAAKFGLTA